MFQSMIKLEDNFLFFLSLFYHFLAIFWYIIVKNATFEVEIQKTMIDFDRVTKIW